METRRSDSGASLPPRKRLLAGLKQNGWFCSDSEKDSENGSREKANGEADSPGCISCGATGVPALESVKNGKRFVFVCKSCNCLLNSGGICCCCFRKISDDKGLSVVALSCCKCRRRVHFDCVPKDSGDEDDCSDSKNFVCMDCSPIKGLHDGFNGGKVRFESRRELGFENGGKENGCMKQNELGLAASCNSDVIPWTFLVSVADTAASSVDKTSGCSVHKLLCKQSLITPATDIIGISVGNEVLFNGDRALISQLLPAMQNLHIALAGVSLDKQIKVSTPHSMAILSTSVPPSAGRFNESFDMKSLLDFLQKIGAPLMINSYPFFAYKSNPTDQTLAYALFKPNPGFYDSNTGLTYSNMFDAQLDAVYSAMKYLGYPGIDIVVAETGWPSAGDPTEAGVSLQNAITYNGNLIKHVTSMVGTPLRPNRYIKTYIFALFNEDLKPGPSSERNYGLFKPDMTMSYDVGLLQSRSAGPSPSPPRTGGPVTAPPTRTEGPVTAPPTRTGLVTAPPTRTEGPVTAPPMGKVWCITKPGADEKTLQANLNYACGQGIDCGPIQPGGPCYSPNTVACHAAYAMNAYYQAKGRNSWNCDFAQTGAITTTDPSYGSCMYPAA